MDRSEFERRFVQCLERAALDASSHFGRPFKQPYVVDIQGLGGGIGLSIVAATDRLFLSEDQFFLVIDVGVWAIRDGAVAFFVRPSGHPPVSWDRTWDPEANGPFKVIVFEKLQDI